ncbi:MAG: hypothetical protein J6W42_09625 [Bacteroidaceae bacterium]|nr:hypothetical protein [Bacteroidaceae bacterium]
MNKFTVFMTALMLSVSSVSAQNHWGVSNPTSQAEDYTPMFIGVTVDGATLKNSFGGGSNPFQLGVFIEGECRAAGTSLEHGTGGGSTGGGSWYFRINVPNSASNGGSTINFEGRPVSFHIYDTRNGVEYVMNETTSFSSMTVGQPSSPFMVELIQLTGITMDVTTMEVTEGESKPIPYKTVPATATNPILFYECYGSSFISAASGMVTGNQVSADAQTLTVYAGDPSLATDLSASISVQVVEVNVAVDGISVIKSVDNVTKGDKLNMNEYAAVTPTNASNTTILWTSSNENVVRKNSTGAWEAVGGGQAVMTGKPADNTVVGADYKITVTINVKSYIETLNVTQSEMTVWDGENFSLDGLYTIGPSDVTEQAVVWTSSAPSVVEISGSTAKPLTAGNAILTVTQATAKPGTTAVSAQIAVTVWAHVTGITANPKSYTAAVGEVLPIASWYSIQPTNAHNQNVSWISDEPDIVKAEQLSTGGWKVTALAKGTAHLTVLTEDKGKSDNITVTVMQPLTSVSLNSSTYLMNNKESMDISYTFNPANADIDKSKFSVVVTPMVIADTSWKLAEVSGSYSDITGGMKWTLNPRALGQGTVKIVYDGNPVAQAIIKVGQSISYTNGWSWLSIPAGDKLGTLTSVNEVYGAAFKEARSQSNVYINDSNWGMFGTSTNMSGDMFKILLNTASLEETGFVMYDVTTDTMPKALNDGWTWLYYPYQFDYTLTELDEECGWSGSLPAGTIIKSKDGKIATLADMGTYNEWTGTLTGLVAGQGYLVFAPAPGFSIIWASESAMGQPASQQQPAPVRSSVSPWRYDHSRFSDNMAIIADLDGVELIEGMTVGAFVGGECRGEGSVKDGRLFISVHGLADEKVTFRLYTPEGQAYYRLVESFDFSQSEGSYANPVKLHLGDLISGVNPGVQVQQGTDMIYDLNGRRVENPSNGIFIINGNKTIIR